MQNNLIDLNNHLFAQLERLNDEDITEDQLNKELRRSEGMTKMGLSSKVCKFSFTPLYYAV